MISGLLEKDRVPHAVSPYGPTESFYNAGGKIENSTRRISVKGAAGTRRAVDATCLSVRGPRHCR